jgi:hypothetical protein
MSNINGSLWCAIRGPVLLITIGTLFAVDHFGPYGITRTWPIILIVLGLLKLLERAAVRQALPPAAPPAPAPGGPLP